MTAESDTPIPADIAEAASLARSATRLLDDIAAGRQPIHRLESCTWRLADALARAARAAEEAELAGKLPGVDDPTGLGAQLRRGAYDATEAVRETPT